MLITIGIHAVHAVRARARTGRRHGHCEGSVRLHRCPTSARDIIAIRRSEQKAGLQRQLRKVDGHQGRQACVPSRLRLVDLQGARPRPWALCSGPVQVVLPGGTVLHAHTHVAHMATLTSPCTCSHTCLYTRLYASAYAHVQTDVSANTSWP